MKKKYADHSKVKDILEKEYKKIDLKDDEYFAAASLTDIKKVEKQWRIPRKNGERDTILDIGYKWLTLYPKDEKFVIIAMYNPKLELVEFYFDIAKKIKYKAKIPSYEDLYLDITMTANNEVEFVDEDELEEAYKLADVKQKDYEIAKKAADKIVSKFHRTEEFEKLKEISEKYLEKLINLRVE